MTIKKHMCIDVNEMLQHPERLVGCITVNGYTLKAVEEVRRFLNEAHEDGIKLITLGDCDNFNNTHGCLGHIINE